MAGFTLQFDHRRLIACCAWRCAAGLLFIALTACATDRDEPAELTSEISSTIEESAPAPQPANAEEASAAEPPPAHRQEPSSEAGAPDATDQTAGHRRADHRAEPDPPRIIRPFDDVLVLPEKQRVEIRAWVCLDVGFLEQIACSPGTREHEALVVIRAEANHIHAALLLAGFEPGRPGEWIWHAEEREVELIPPEGDAVDLWVRYDREDGERIVEPIRRWIRDHHANDSGNHDAFPDEPWIFGGSRFEENPEWMGPGEHYVADITGSIIGLVTFGDEILGYREVISDAAAVHEPEWEVDPDRIPPLETEVTIIIQPRGAAAPPARGPDEVVADDSG